MAAVMDSIHVKHLPISDEAISRSHEISVETTNADEDGSSQSTSSPAIFDRTDPYMKVSKSTWQRLGSLESNASTANTSFGSSASADDLSASKSSHKRTRDGNIKPASPQISRASSALIHSIELNSPVADATPSKRRQPTTQSKSRSKLDTSNFRARSSIPSSLSTSVFASQCIEAAISSRLDPYALHRGEHDLLNNEISATEVTVYLNIRNAILRLWLRNPLCHVSEEEAAGCAKEPRFFGLAVFAHRWLRRNGYIDFGCVDFQKDETASARVKKLSKQRTVVVLGAGVSGLTTARQLENQFMQQQEYWSERGEKPPRVIVLEGRKRIGGRVYSKPLRTQDKRKLPGQYRNTAEMGAMIVTGFERGNPLDVVIRAQLGIPYHMLTDALTIYDTDGKPVDEKRDMLNTDLYTDISDRTGEFRATSKQTITLQGDEDLINRARDPAQHEHIDSKADSAESFDLIRQRKPISKRGRRTNAPPGNEKISVRTEVLQDGDNSIRAARAAHELGWRVKHGVSSDETVSLKAIADSYEHPSLGFVMDAAIKQYQAMLNIQPRDMRLLNWHHANLEYANAAPVTRLSLSGHDQDNGNEFEGAHSEIIGGYTQMPRGLMNVPTKLDVRFNHVVESIHYDGKAASGANTVSKIVCTNGTIIEADEIVLTVPLGVLKSGSIAFDPPLPEWKLGAVDRLGFGLLNKVVLVYDAPFWDESRDMFGLLNEAEEKDSLDPAHYELRRGRYYLIWNASRISGRAMLIALMAGHAAYQAEKTDTTTMLVEITDRLRKIFKTNVPAPREVIVTRWRNDPFSRGTYSYVAQKTQPNDYNLMAQSVGNLHFAGEATCGTHPATVHGAFLSGLRAASDVMDVMTGEIELPVPLVGPVSLNVEHKMKPSLRKTSSTAVMRSPIIKTEPGLEIAAAPLPMYVAKPEGPPSKSVCSKDPSFWATSSFDDTSDILEATIASIVFAEIGDRPLKPARSGINPFLLYTRAHWDTCKAQCEQQGNTSSGRNVIRQVLGQWWKDLSEQDRRPYMEQSRAAQNAAEAERKAWAGLVAQWDANAARIKAEYLLNNPQQGAPNMAGRRKTNVSNSIALDFVKS